MVTCTPETRFPGLLDLVCVGAALVELVVTFDECEAVAETEALEAAAQTELADAPPVDCASLQSSANNAAQLWYVTPGHAAVHS